MPFTFNESRLIQAMQLEDAVGCDIQAGLDVGANAHAYLAGADLASAEGYLAQDKLMAVLQDELGNTLSQDDLDLIACSTQQAVHERLLERLHSAKTA